MAYRMHEITETVRIGETSDGRIDVEVWPRPRGWINGSGPDPENIFIPSNAIEGVYEFLRRR